MFLCSKISPKRLNEQEQIVPKRIVTLTYYSKVNMSLFKASTPHISIFIPLKTEDPKF